MEIPPPAGFEALVVANQANITGTQQIPSLHRSCPVCLEPVCTLVVNVGAQPLHEQVLQVVTCCFASDVRYVTKHLVELLVILVIFEVFTMCPIVGGNGGRVCLA